MAKSKGKGFNLPNGSKGLGKGSGSGKGGKFNLGNGEHGVGVPGKGSSTYGANQLKGRYNRKRINSEYGGGK